MPNPTHWRCNETSSFARSRDREAPGTGNLFGKYSGQTVKVDGEELLVMKEEDLFAVVEK